jgi:hypothetical protein
MKGPKEEAIALLSLQRPHDARVDDLKAALACNHHDHKHAECSCRELIKMEDRPISGTGASPTTHLSSPQDREGGGHQMMKIRYK